MTDLERASVAVREHPSATAPPVEVIQRRAAELKRRRRVGWSAAVVAAVLVVAVIGFGTLRSRTNDQSIVTGPGPGPNEQTLQVPMVNNGDDETARAAADTMRRRLEQSDFVDVRTSTTNDTLTLAGSAEDLELIKRVPWLFASTVDIRSVLARTESDPDTCKGSEPVEGSNYTASDGACVTIGHGSGANLTSASSASYVPVAETPSLAIRMEEASLQQWASTFVQQCAELDAQCPIGAAAYFTEQGVAFVARPVAPADLDASLVLFGAPDVRTAREAAAVLDNPLPTEVLFGSLAAETVEVLTAKFDIGAGITGDDALAGWIVRRRIPTAFAPDDAVIDPAEIEGKSAAFEIPRNSVIVDGMFE